MEVKHSTSKDGWRPSAYATHSKPGYCHPMIFISTGLSIFGRLIFVFYRPLCVAQHGDPFRTLWNQMEFAFDIDPINALLLRHPD